MRIGVIGTGNMGGMLAKSFSKTETYEVYLFNRTKSKADALAAEMPNLKVCLSLGELVRSSQYILLCTKAIDGQTVLAQIGRELSPKQVLLTTISTISLVDLEQFTNAKIVKLIPSLTQSVGRGVILLSYGSRITKYDHQAISTLFSSFAKPIVVEESQIRLGSDLTSCGPAFMSYLYTAWIQAAADTGTIPQDMAENMIRDTIIGLAGMLEEGMTFQDIMTRITVPGGVTARGIESLGHTPYRMFEALHRATRTYSHMPQSADKTTKLSGDTK